jgi:hypothetical protein
MLERNILADLLRRWSINEEEIVTCEQCLTNRFF